MRELQPKLFRRAVQIAGDAEKLCKVLQVDPHALQLWSEGRATPPDWVLQTVIDLILKDDLARAAQDRREQPRVAVPPDGADGQVGATTGPRSP